MKRTPFYLHIFVSFASFALLGLGTVAADTIRVPLDFPTIQEAIDSAVDGDTVLVAPGTFVENINFFGKAITVTSEEGPEVTIIDGAQVDSVVTFESGEGLESVLSGFTLTNGRANFGGGGLRIWGSSPTITNNTITNNKASSGLGIEIYFGSPIIQGNIITKNTRTGGGGGTGGGGICIIGNGSAQILDNVISDNVMPSAHGGGISLFAAGTPTIRGNTISGNSVSGLIPCAKGGGISLVNDSDALIVQNVITGNSAGCGGGIFWLVPFSPRGPLLVNNTIDDNDSTQGSGIFADGFDAQTLLVNNIVVAKEGQTAIFCGDSGDTNPPIFEFNNVFSPLGTAYGGICTDQTGINGNISADPLFEVPEEGDYHLKPDSPSIDAGDNTAPELPDTDFDGNERILDGNGDGEAVVDMGGFEHQAIFNIAIDIKPDSDLNSINPRSRGVFPIAILTTETFDAVMVDPLSVEFGPDGAQAAHGQGHFEDVDGDGDLDLIFHFNTQETGIHCGDTEAFLTGESFDGQVIEGSDSINTIGCN